MEPPSCDLKGTQPHTLQMFLEIIAYKNHYSVVKGYFGSKAVAKLLFHMKLTAVKYYCSDLGNPRQRAFALEHP